MPRHHVERHFTGGLVVRDAVIGMADGLTVPFALAAGLTGAVDTTWIIVVAGLAEIAADEAAEVIEVLQQYGLRAEEARPVVEALQKRPEAWVDFMMRFELGL